MIKNKERKDEAKEEIQPRFSEKQFAHCSFEEEPFIFLIQLFIYLFIHLFIYLFQRGLHRNTSGQWFCKETHGNNTVPTANAVSFLSRIVSLFFPSHHGPAAEARVCVGVLVHLCACLPSPHTPVAGLDYHLNSETKNSATFLHPLTIAAKHPPPPPFYWCQYLSLLRLSSKGCVQLTKHQRHAREKRGDVLERHARHYIIHRLLHLTSQVK